MHAYSSLERATLREGADASRFDFLASNGYRVHTRGDALSDFAHLAHADVLVVATSSFSHAAALLNRGCILTVHAHPRYLPMLAWSRRFPALFNWSLEPAAAAVPSAAAMLRQAGIRAEDHDSDALVACLKHARRRRQHGPWA